MNETPFPIQSTQTLIKASIAAIVLAVVIFMTIVLPSEYNVDPTGAGKLLGLTVLAKESQAIEPKQTAAPKQSVVENSPNLSHSYQENEAIIKIPANRGVEYKFQMQQYANLTYQWSSQGEPLFFDFHGEPKGDTTGYFESYALATTHEMKGSMTVPFEGVHGWYWKNTSDKDIIVTLKTQGYYQVVGLLQ